MSDDIRRIGRKPLPGEATIAMMRERPEVLDHMAFCEWSTTIVGLGHTLEARAQWDAMSEADRETWRERTRASATETARAFDAEHETDPPPTGGGEPLPVERIA